MSYAAGANSVAKFNEFGERNFDMPTVFRDEVANVPVWPQERVVDNDYRWKHGDMHRIGLVYIFKLYEKINQTGEL